MRPLAGSALLFGLLTLLILSAGCAHFGPQYRKGQAQWASAEIPDPAQLVHRIYLAGGYGYAADDRGLRQLAAHLRNAPDASTLLLLGDNTGPTGLPPEDHPRFPPQLRQLDRLLDSIRHFPGRLFFLPGHLEWKRYGLAGLERLNRYLQERTGRPDILLPRPGCAGPEVVELNPNLNLLLVDSQWWLEDWTGQAGINAGCGVGSRESFPRQFRESLRDRARGTTIVALHHSLFSAGRHGGVYPARDHLFPLRDIHPALWIPLPGLGSLPPFYRFTVGTRQDIAYPQFRQLRENLLSAARQNGRFIFVSGHERVLHYLEQQQQRLVISGSGGGGQATRLGRGGQFASSETGLSVLAVYADQSVWLEFWAADGPTAKGRLLFRKQIQRPSDGLPAGALQYPVPPIEPGSDSVRIELSPDNFQRTAAGEFLWGSHFRDLYNLQVRSPLLWLEGFKGGTQPIRAGNGLASENLFLQTRAARTYRLRSIRKDPSRSLPYPFNNSLANVVVRDNFSAQHPLAPVPLAALQRAGGLLHPRPRAVFLPRQPALGAYNAGYGNSLYLLEEAPDNSWAGDAVFGRAGSIVTTYEMQRRLWQFPDHRVDAPLFVRARLFDLLVGDWDRNADHWRWARQQGQGVTIYQPIALDRDQAFSRYDGLLLGTARLLSPAVKQLRNYDTEQIGSIKWMTYTGRFLDQNFLNELPWPAWEEQVSLLETTLTDSLVYQSLQDSWPRAVFEASAHRILPGFRYRRKMLRDLARRYYLHLARNVNVVGTRGPDIFQIERKNRDSVRVRIFASNTRGAPGRLFYDRTFLTRETRSVVLYGLSGQDQFRVEGWSGRKLKVRMIGGPGKDAYLDHSDGPRLHKINLMYDMRDEERQLERGPSTGRRFTRDPVRNTFNPEALDQDYPLFQVIPGIGLNPDDGLVLGLGGQLTTYGFRKRPFQTRQKLMIYWGTLTNGFAIDYAGQVANVIGVWDAYAGVRYQTPLYTINFYGLSNESKNPEDELGRNFNRVRQNLFSAFPALRLSLGTNESYFAAGFRYEQVRIDRVPGRIFADSLPAGVDSTLFSWQRFIGPHIEFNFRNLNNQAYPSRGIDVKSELGLSFRTTGRAQQVPYFQFSMATYLGLDPAEHLVLAGRVGLKHLFTDDFVFYQASTIGGNGPQRTTRGFRRDRFAGRSALYGNSELRWRFLQSENRILPFSLGVYGGFDLGRVWVDGEQSQRWHYGYGGGIFVSPFNLFTGAVDIFRGDDERFTVYADFKFYF